MKTLVRQSGWRKTVLALAVLAAFGPLRAQTSEAEASVSVGAGVATGDRADRALFGQYNGLRTHDAYGLLSVDYSRRNAATGTLTEFQGLNLGLDTRELNFLWKRQGDWKFSADYGELVRRDPYSINTGLLGAGTTTPQVVHLADGPGTGLNLDLKTRRRGLGVSLAKWVSPTLEFEASAKSENKTGARQFGIGITCPSTVAPGCAPTTGTNPGWAVLMLPERINSNHSQVEARLNYAGAKLRLSAGYYGSFYSNSNATMNPDVPGSLNNPLGTLLPLNTGLQSILNLPVALAPDNQAHHFDLTGNYAFTPTTRASFKFAYARATQDQNFAGAGLSGAPAGVDSLDGKVNTTLAQIGLTSRPLPKLSLLAEFRFEDKDDRTPIALYNIEGTSTYTNRRLPIIRRRGKLQAAYQISSDYQGSVGADYNAIDRGDFASTSAVSGVSALRLFTEEVGWHIELRRRMTETFSGALRFESSNRHGSNWLQPNSGRGVTEITDTSTAFNATSIFMPTLADRDRDKVKLLAMWQPTDALSLQFSGEYGRDNFNAPSKEGVRDTRMSLYSLDWTYVVSDEWNVNGYASRGNQKLNQARPAGYVLAFDNTSTSLGAGFTGKPTEKIEVGGGLSFIYDKNVYGQTLEETANAGSVALLAATGGLPDIIFRRAELKLFGKYELSKASAVRLDAIHQRSKFNDWGYGYSGVPFTFSDNTTVSLKQLQQVTFVGVTYIYAWR